MTSRKFWILIAVPAMAVAAGLGLQEREPSAPDRNLSPFDGSRAFADLERVVEFGPRPAGSAALAETREYILDELRQAGLEPIVDAFVASTPLGDIEMANIRAVRPGPTARTILVGGHYDTKRQEFEFVGANDGGSSTAVVLELARVSGDLDMEHTLEFIFFDGEEAVRDWTDTDRVYGSRHDVDRRYDAGVLDDLAALILVDMIGDRDLEILQETSSTGFLREIVWETAGELGYASHFGSRLAAVEDDHIPYLRAGIAAIDLIDFDYPYWHTAADTLDKTDAASLGVVGDVLYHALPVIDARLAAAR
jgi:Zn-dependent M28 family amino/carboxypeptidase